MVIRECPDGARKGRQLFSPNTSIWKIFRRIGVTGIRPFGKRARSLNLCSALGMTPCYFAPSPLFGSMCLCLTAWKTFAGKELERTLQNVVRELSHLLY